MSRIKNAFKSIALILGMVACAHATSVAYSGPFVGTEGTASGNFASSQTFTRDMNTTGDRVSIQIVTSSTTLTAKTFNSSSYVLNTSTINIIGNGFPSGLGVLFTVPASTPAISGLTTGTTYFVIALTPNSFELAANTANVYTKTPVVLASSQAVTDTYTLTPINFTNTGSAGIQLQWSDDKVTFFNATTGNYNAAFSSTTYATAGTSSLIDLGFTNHRYLRVNATSPTTGAVKYTVTSNERYSYGH